MSLLGGWLAGCMPDVNYQAYVDENKKGEQVFLKDLQVCRHFANEHLKRGEGSEGDRLNRKRSLFLFCMEDHNWILKQ